MGRKESNMIRLLLSGTAVLLILGSAVVGADYTEEYWNDGGAQENGWFYWNEDNGQVSPHHHEPLNWAATGGVGDSGHVYTDELDLLTPHHDETRAYYPAYNTINLTPPHYINLDIPDAEIRVYLTAKVGPFGNLNFHGGVITPFVGFWHEGTQRQAFFYNVHGIAANEIPKRFSHGWKEFTFPCAPSDWDVLVIDDPPPSGVDDVTDLLHWPQQWGFTILDDDGPPIGVLGLDNFRILPEPATLIVLAMSLPALLRRRRSRG